MSPSKDLFTRFENYNPEDDYNAEGDLIKAVIQTKTLVLHEQDAF